MENKLLMGIAGEEVVEVWVELIGKEEFLEKVAEIFPRT